MRLASASLDGTARIWDIASVSAATPQEAESVVPSAIDQLYCCKSSGDSSVAVWSIVYSPDGLRLITGDKAGQLTMWDAETGVELDKSFEAPNGGYVSAAYSRDGRWIVTACEDCTARMYNARTLELVGKFRGHLGPIHCLAVSNEFLITGGSDHSVKIWDLTSHDQ
jgi:WD40 repeat protein